MQNESESKTNFSYFEIDTEGLDFHSEIVKRYLEGGDFPPELINTQSTDDLLSNIISSPLFDSVWRNTLSETILDQYKHLCTPIPEGGEVLKNIEKLKLPNTVTVTTGQQIHIFLGPLFVVYKILSCVAHAKVLQEERPDLNVIPVFWMATEDHDFEEIASVKLYNQTYTWSEKSKGAVGRLNPTSLLSMVDELRERLDKTESNMHFMDVCEIAYKSHPTFSLATRYIINTLFGDTGLVVIDPDDVRLKFKIKNQIINDLFDHSFSPKIDENIALMKANGMKAPINTRPINYFYIDQNGRNRIEQTADLTFQIVDTNTTFQPDEMVEIINQNPERFSPNALLRPVYQQTILPNAIYVCGGSEIIYWFELKALMDNLSLSYPKLKIRKSVFLLGEMLLKKLSEANMEIKDIFRSALAFQNIAISLSDAEITELNSLYKNLLMLLHKLELRTQKSKDLGQVKSLNKARNQFQKELENQISTLVQEQFNSNKNLSKLINLKDKVYSSKYLQERNSFIINHLSESLDLIPNSHNGLLSYFKPTSLGICTSK